MKDVVGCNALSCGLNLIPGGPRASGASVNFGDAEVFTLNHHLWTPSRHQQGLGPHIATIVLHAEYPFDDSTLNERSQQDLGPKRSSVQRCIDTGPACMRTRHASLASLLLSCDATPFSFSSTRRTLPLTELMVNALERLELPERDSLQETDSDQVGNNPNQALNVSTLVVTAR
ncbi:hypothetical protein PsYK624_032580 [Phanerochaete sordida]|uniref:Uncharacterized protein n=1 Tax=Phanerochaete sordida TaxID=48140 RepID=A0A9P3L9I5_9APHY|nr:hypothetical protein PsYK624_032580 [Phanerochaete sordida]